LGIGLSNLNHLDVLKCSNRRSWANGAGWAEESHPFSSPSYGRVSPGIIEYPFNHGCGTSREYQSDVQAWIYDTAGRRSPPVIVHLACPIDRPQPASVLAGADTPTPNRPSNPALSSPIASPHPATTGLPPPAAKQSVERLPPPPSQVEPELARLEPTLQPKPDISGRVSGVISTSRIKVGDQWIELYGINDPTQRAHTPEMIAFIEPSRGRVECYEKTAGKYQCYAGGKDLALLALGSGLARPTPDAPVEYRTLSQPAQH